MKKISVIIPCLNEKETISTAIVSISNEIKNIGFEYEIIVVDNGSSDGSDILAVESGAIVIYSDASTVAEVRNCGVRSASGKILIFLDADIVVNLGWADIFLDIYSNISVNDNYIFGSHPRVPDNIHQILHFWYQGIAQDVRNTHLGTGHMIVSRKVFDKLNGFDKDLISGEDFDFCCRAKAHNIEVMSIPQLVVFHYGYPNNFTNFLKREIWHGQGDCCSLKRIIKSKAAIIGLIFLLFNSMFVFFIFINITFSLFFLLAIFILTLSVNIFKFGIDGVKSLICRSIVAYLYLLGRGVAPFFTLVKHANLRPKQN